MLPRSTAPLAALGLLSLALLGAPARARTIFVDAKAPEAGQDGAAWGTAFRTVQAGVNAAAPGDEVWVAGGAYTGTVSLATGVALYGGFAGTEASRDARNWRTYATVLDGGRMATVVAVGPAVEQPARLDGFTVLNGGRAGVYVDRGKVEIANSTVRGNLSTTDGVGGGVYVEGTGSATIANSVITSNGGGGGGVYAGRYAMVRLINVTVTANSGYSGGGGVVLDAHSNAELSNCIVAFNTGGVLVTDPTAALAIRNCDVYLNDGPAFAGVPDPTGTNGNIAVDPMLSSAYSDPHLQPGSPCIDAGDTALVLGSSDIDGQPRVQGTKVDIGADESDGTTWPNPARVFRVSPTGSDANTGFAWQTAKATVQGALKDAQGADEVWVAQGTYKGTIVVPAGVALYGGFAGTEGLRSQRDPRANPTTLDGDRKGCVVTVPFRSAVIDGFTIRNGSDRGVTVSSGSAMIAGNRICDNTSSHPGGGLFVGGPSTVSGNIITGNTSEADGGGLYVWLCRAQVADNAISGNIASGNGGGAYATGSDISFTDNTVCGNRSFLSGGGLYLEYATADRNLLAGNRAEGKGGGAYMFSGSLANLTLTGNTASYGGGLYITSGPARGCTIVGNKAKSAGGAIATFFGAVTVANTIAAFNSSGIQRATGTLTLRNCDVFSNAGADYTGIADPTGANGNISADPLFVDRLLGDLRLRDGSPCIDAGANDAVIGSQDGDGLPRIMGAAVDIGANETGAIPGAVWYVSPTGNDENSGKSWATARKTIGAMLGGTQYGAGVGDEVWVAAGTYSENIQLPSGVALYGGFLGTETQRDQRNTLVNATVLSGGSRASVVTSTGRRAVLDGFTIRSGRGGGVTVDSGSATLRNCLITGNTAAIGAGVLAAGSVTLRNCSIDTSTAAEDGGALYVAGSAAVADSFFVSNTASSRSGGGAYVAGNMAMLRDTVELNSALNANGGGVYVAGGAATIADTLVVANRAYTGSGISVNGLAAITNCTISDNSQSGFGGGIYVDGYGDATVANSIVSNNHSGIYYKGGLLSVSHSDLFANTWYDFAAYGSNPSPVGSNGNISASPQFVNRAAGNYKLLSGSPCIDTGDDAVVPAGDTDRDGAPRIRGAHVDMGAFESGPAPITVQDAAQALRIAAGLATASPADTARLDVEAGATPSIDMADATRLARIAAGTDHQ